MFQKNRLLRRANSGQVILFHITFEFSVVHATYVIRQGKSNFTQEVLLLAYKLSCRVEQSAVTRRDACARMLFSITRKGIVDA